MANVLRPPFNNDSQKVFNQLREELGRYQHNLPASAFSLFSSAFDQMQALHDSGDLSFRSSLVGFCEFLSGFEAAIHAVEECGVASINPAAISIFRARVEGATMDLSTYVAGEFD